MLYSLKLIYLIKLLYIISSICEAKRKLTDMFYNESIYETAEHFQNNIGVCYSYANHTHRFGCFSKKLQTHGRAKLIKSLSDLNDIHMSNKSIEYIIIINIFNIRTLHNLFSYRDILSRYLNGIVFYKNIQEYSNFSDSCTSDPDEPEWVDEQYQRFIDAEWPFPIIYLHNDTKMLHNILNCSE